MANKIGIDELVHWAAGPEPRPVEYRFGKREFKGLLQSPGEHVSQADYQREGHMPSGTFGNPSSGGE